MTALTQARLFNVLCYLPDTGEFFWLEKLSKNTIVGESAGCKSGGRVRIRIDGVSHKAHRLAWLYMTGEWPKEQIDHKNGNPLDNSFQNLRDVSHAVNRQNLRKAHADSKTGVLGVVHHQGRFVAQICKGRERTFLGSFDTPELAAAAYIDAKRAMHEGCTI